MKKLACIAALCAIAFSAQADEEFGYAGFGLGYATQKVDYDLAGFSESKGKFGGKLYAGYQFNKNFALEGGYNYLNKDKREASETVLGVTGHARLEIQGHIFSLAAKGILPINENISLFGKAGGALYYSKATLSANEQAAGHTIASYNKSYTKTAGTPLIGIGAEFKFDKNMTLVAEYENFFKPKVASKEDIKMKRVDMFSIGLRTSFN